MCSISLSASIRARISRFVSSQIKLVWQKLINQHRQAGEDCMSVSIEPIDSHRQANHCFDKSRFSVSKIGIKDTEDGGWVSGWHSSFKRVSAAEHSIMWFLRLIRLFSSIFVFCHCESYQIWLRTATLSENDATHLFSAIKFFYFSYFCCLSSDPAHSIDDTICFEFVERKIAPSFPPK